MEDIMLRLPIPMLFVNVTAKLKRSQEARVNTIQINKDCQLTITTI